MVLDRYFTSFLPFPWPINYNHAYWCTKSSTHSLPNWFWSKKISFPWIHGVTHGHILWASCRTCEWRTATRIVFKFNIDPTFLWWKSYIAKGAPSFEIEPFQAWYYCISLNSCTLVILLQVNLASSDEPKTICEGFYEIEITSIFAWSSIPNIGHYYWLHGLIHLSPPIVRWIT